MWCAVIRPSMTDALAITELSFTSDGTIQYLISIKGSTMFAQGPYNVIVSCAAPEDDCGQLLLEFRNQAAGLFDSVDSACSPSNETSDASSWVTSMLNNDSWEDMLAGSVSTTAYGSLPMGHNPRCCSDQKSFHCDHNSFRHGRRNHYNSR